ncbi:GNAT family N-acetyltransferase [Microbacterium xanthum]|uniref:GNAT family N-acetyltransferase n=1 Tax=Microbacterium xanthum TaxID=3079794 RepID=UPI002AD340AD|nr:MULTISPECIES: GNAT family N-acetyltransferase [unclassified Microbacterium]MDZ8170566.1 GNAT family N-acetyltransferase [Microbacterium sp. KSW-48]MDZ8201090.1 GNAT family N-acetyltransferase [Microbacterium sp. SSW1-59]
MTDTYAVRRARSGDAAAIAAVHVTSWREAYTGRIPDEVLDGMDVTSRAEVWRRILAGEVAGEAGEVWVAELDGDVIGFASAGRCRDDDAVPGRRELYAIYVLEADYGTGVADMLLDAAIGDAAASLWVLEDNPRARAFYRRHGFTPDGAAKTPSIDGVPIREVRLVRIGSGA